MKRPPCRNDTDMNDHFLLPLPFPNIIPDPPEAPAFDRKGLCPCCGASDRLWALPDNRPLTELAEEAAKVLRPPIIPDTARALLLRHVPAEVLKQEPDDRPSAELNAAELHQLKEIARGGKSACSYCHAWLFLNGRAAAQCELVYLPDLNPASVVWLNRQAINDMQHADSTIRQRGANALTALLLHRRPVRRCFGTNRPADFAAILLRYPPAARVAIRQRMSGLALILTPSALETYR